MSSPRIATLTVGFGTFAVVYTAADRILIRPLPYHDPHDHAIRERAGDETSLVLTGPAIAALQGAGGVIQDAAALMSASLTLPATADTDAMRIVGMHVTPPDACGGL